MKPVVLAENTSEALRVVRVGRSVFKALRPPESFATHRNARLRCSANEILSRWRLMADVSIGNPPLNPLIFIEPPGCMFASAFIDGRKPTPEELQAVVIRVGRLRLGVMDVTRDNVVVGKNGPVVVDWFMSRR